MRQGSKRCRRVAGAALLLVASWSSPANAGKAAATPASAGETQVRSAIEQAWAEHIAAAQRKDLDAVMAIYADDVVYVTPDLQSVRGAAAVRKMEAGTLATATVIEARHSIRGLQVDGDVAYELGSVAGAIQSGDAGPARVVYHFMAMWNRAAGGRWRIRYLVGQPETVVEPGDPAKAGIGGGE